jgi:hypothetical protein
VVNTSKRIAQAYVQHGAAFVGDLEYETVLQRRPDDADVQAALKQIEDKASNAAAEPSAMEPAAEAAHVRPEVSEKSRPARRKLKMAARRCRRFLSRANSSAAGDFDLCWRAPDLSLSPPDVIEPFIQTLHEKGLLLMEKSLKLLADKSRTAFLPLERYDVDIDLTRGFPADVCRRWCVLPFDRMSKSILVATANPFNQEAAKELAEATSHRLLWYLARAVGIGAATSAKRFVKPWPK